MPSDQDDALEMSSDAAIERVRINYRWLLKLRWTAVVGQLLTIAVVAIFVSTDLPFLHLAIVVGATAVTNIILSFRFGLGRAANPTISALNEAELVAIMAFDVILFSSLLFVTGGAENPFSIFFLVHVVLAAIVLRPVWAWALALECVASYSFLFVQDTSFPNLRDADQLLEVQHWGSLAAFVTVAVIIAWFAVHIHEELSKREQDLLEIRQKRSRLDRLEALITLAAGAAHELSTPLSTIAVAAGELHHDLKRWSQESGLGAEALEDAELIRNQVKRCRDILEQMSADSGEISGEPMISARLSELIEWILGPIPNGDRVDLVVSEGLLVEIAFFPRKALTRALRGMITNALDADEGGNEVKVAIRREGANMIMVVTDRGAGMTPDVSKRAFEPFFTTKAPGRGMGLGLYLSRSVIERLSGSIELVKTGSDGTTMRAVIPLFSSPSNRELELERTRTAPKS